MSEMEERIDSMGEALERVERQVAEIPAINENLQAIRDHFDI